MTNIVAIEHYPLVLPVGEIYGGAAGVLEDCRSLILRIDINRKELIQVSPTR